MEFLKFPDWSGTVRNLYWHLRMRRSWDEAKRRRYYRKIFAEKKRLIEAGVDKEQIRLLCRLLSQTQKRAMWLRGGVWFEV